ncbi:MAG: hypothetical protein ACYC3I_20225 [Gemmataceae bacterium]
MRDNDSNDPSSALEGVSRRLPRRGLVLVGAMAAGLALVLAFLFRDWLPRAWRGDDDLGKRIPPGALADYVPEDSEAVLAVNVRQLLESPLGRRPLLPPLRHLLDLVEQRLRWLDLARINPLEDLDTLRISFAPAADGQPLWLARGRFDRTRFQRGADKLQETTLDQFHVWEYSDRAAKRTTLLAPLGDMLVVSETRESVRAALRQAFDPQPIRVRDAVLRELLTKVDRRQSVWLAASIKSLGPISGIDNLLLKMLLRPVLAHAESVQGGIVRNEDVQAVLHFRTATEQDAAQLEMDLNSVRDLAREGSWLLGRQKELLPLLHLLGTSQISRDGTMILWRCRLAADQLDG